MVALRRYQAPACASCGVMAPECHVPIGDGEKALCWLCAHAVTTHGAAVGDAPADCDCDASEIYPASVIALRGLRAVTSAPGIAVENGPPLAPRASQLPTLAHERPKRWSHLAAARAAAAKR